MSLSINTLPSLGTEHRASCMLTMDSTTEPYPSPNSFSLEEFPCYAGIFS
jgi:hypothetical protein